MSGSRNQRLKKYRQLRDPLAGIFGLMTLMTPVVAQTMGILEFFAQGEDLATEGFVAPKLTKDGWELRFEHIFVSVAEVTAYQTDPPFNPAASASPVVTAQAALPGLHTLDLVQDANADGRIRVGSVEADPGHFNALSWRMVPAPSGPSAGSVMVFLGTASREGVSVSFDLRTNMPHGYHCGEYVGDERKGLVGEAGVAEVEMTFHLDHVFGRADKAADDPMNLAAHGFDPYAMGSGPQTIDLQGLHLGHVGEGHCRLLSD